ncbi:MAG TPA: hypothetical protein VNU93_00020, partial [Verrucomicrobiae bacterium]|nr:hypothetical protein [Verrucomicrobiae bacterium]
MDSTNNFLTAFKQWLAAVDEGYLVGIANRGLYNRAQKDLGDNPTVQIEYGDKSVNCTLPDGTVCSLSNELQKLTCSCPARGVCKHILMSILYLKQDSPSPGSAGNEVEAGTISETVSDTESEANIGESQAGAKADYSVLLNLSPGALRKLCGDKAYDECVLRLEFGIRARVEEGSLLTVRFEAENISVRFPPQNPLDYSICSCKATGFCRHRAEAIIQFQLARGVTTQADLARGLSVEFSRDTLSMVKQLLEEILELGLSRLPNTVVENLEQAAVMCHSADLPNLEKQLRAIKGEMEQYLDKNVSFSSIRVRKRISILYGTVLALENRTAGPELAGEHKSVYFDIPPIEVWGLGAEGWSTKSGYEGITFYFLDTGLKRWFTYTNSRPTYYEDSKASFVKMYKGSPPWAMEGSCEEFSKSKIYLVNGKINAQGRFSASEQSRGAAKGLTQLGELDLSKVG